MPDPTDAFGVPNPVVENTVDDVLAAFEQAKQRNENSLRLMSVASGSKPDAVGAYNTAKDKLGITGDFGDESTVSILHAELAKRNAEKEAALSQLATEYPGLYRLASRDRNAEVMYDDLPMLKLSYGGFQRYLRSANSLDDRPERSAVEAFGQGAQAAQRRFGLLALAIPALVTGDGSAARNAFYDLWDYDTANQLAGAAFKSKFTTDVAEAAGGFAGDPFTFVGMGAGAAASKVSIKAALKANAIVAYAQQTAAAYQDFSRDNMEKGNSPLLSPMQHTLAHLSGLVTGVLEKVSGPVGELSLLKRGGGAAQAASSLFGGFVSEDLEETTQGWLESIAKGESLTLGDLAYQGFLGGVLGGVMGAPGAVSQVMAAKAARDVVIPSAQVIEAVNGVQGIAEAEAALSQSRFAKRTTTRIKDLVAESLGPDQNIFVPRAAWTEVFTKYGLDPAAAAEKYGAIVSGDNLSIPAGDFIANRYFEQNQELKNDILNVVKVSETGLNMAGVDATIADIEKAAKEFTEQQQIEFADKLPDGKTIDDSAEVAEKITSDILGMKTPDGKKVDKLQAQHIGKLHSQFYRQMAIEFGKAGMAFTPKQMFELYPVGFGEVVQKKEGGVSSAPADESLDDVLARIDKLLSDNPQMEASARSAPTVSPTSPAPTRKVDGVRSGVFGRDGNERTNTPEALQSWMDQFKHRATDQRLIMVTHNKDRLVGTSLPAPVEAALKRVEALANTTSIDEAAAALEALKAAGDAHGFKWEGHIKALLDKVIFAPAAPVAPSASTSSAGGQQITRAEWDAERIRSARETIDAAAKKAGLSVQEWAKSNTARGIIASFTGVAIDENGNVSLYEKLEDVKFADFNKVMSNGFSRKDMTESFISDTPLLAGYEAVEENGRWVPKQKLSQAAPAGERGSYDTKTGVIDVSTSRDKSTLLHESAHHFLTVMEKLSTEKGAPDYFKEQFASFRKWIDDNAAEVASSYNVREKSKLRTKPFVEVTADEIKATPFTDEGRKANFHAWAAQHEYFARGFESWVMEGKAPSAEVKSLFARFAAWLKDLYQSIRALDVTMDEGSRRLMARMLATDEMIAAANTEAFHREMTFEALKAKGIPDDMAKRLSTLDAAGQDAARARMIERMARGIAKEDEAKHQAFRDKLVGELQAGEYRKDPLLAAAAAKSYIKGEGYLPGEDEAKINRQGVVFLLGETSPFVKLLEDAGLLTENGQTPEDLASTFGAPDVGVFLEKMALAPTMSEAVEKYVDAEETRILGPLMPKEEATKIAEEAAYGANRMQTAMTMAKVVLEKGSTQKKIAAYTAREAIDTLTNKSDLEKDWLAAEITHKMQKRLDALGDKLKTAEVQGRWDAAAANTALKEAKAEIADIESKSKLEKDWLAAEVESKMQKRVDALTHAVAEAKVQGRWDAAAASKALDAAKTEIKDNLAKAEREKDWLAAEIESRMQARIDVLKDKLKTAEVQGRWDVAGVRAELTAKFAGEIKDIKEKAAASKEAAVKRVTERMQSKIDKVQHDLDQQEQQSRWDAASVRKATTIDTEVLYHAQLPIALAMDPKNLNPTKWGRVANKFAKDALKALEKGEMEAFAVAKQQEAAALVRRDIEQELKDSVKKADKVIAKYVDPNSKDRRELMAGDAAYVQAVDALLGAYGYKPDRPAFPSLAPMPVIAPGLANGPAPGRANTVGEVTDLADALINIREAQKNVGKSVALAKGKELKAYGETLAKAAIAHTSKETGAWVGTRETPNGTMSITGTKEDIIAGFAAKGVPEDAIVFTKERKQVRSIPSKDSLANYSGKFFRLASKLSTYLAILDGGKPGVWTDVGDKLNKQSSVMESITKKYAAQLEKDFYTTSTSNTRIGNTEYSMPMQNRITFAAHWGSESGRIRALEHLRTFIPGDPAKTEAARMRLAEQILASLDARHLDIVEKIWRINNEMTVETEAQHRRMGTIPPARIIESAYKVGDRVMQGGYMTVRWVDKPHAWSLEQVMNGVPTMDMMPGNSSEKARVKQVTGVLDLGMEVALGHIGEVARVLAFREIAADLYSLMNPSTGKVLGIIEQTHGGAWASDFYQSLSSAITGPPPPSNMLDRMAGHLRRNATAGGLLFNIFSAASQFMGVTSTVAEVGAKATATGMTEYATGPVEKHNWIKEKSELMRNRGGLFDANLHELYNYTKRFKFLGKIGRAGFVPIGFTQSIVDDITWLAAFRKAEAEYPGKTEAYHVARADQAVKNSQGAAADMDLTPLHQRHLARLLTLFGTPFTTMINQMQVASGTGDYKKLATTALWTMSATSILMAFLEALRGGGPEEDDYAAWFAKYHLETTLGLHPVTRAFTPSIMAGKLTTIPGTRAASAALGIPEDIYATATGEQDLTTTAKHAISGLPAIVPVPSAAMNRMVDAAIQIIEQDAPLQGVRTLTLGSPPLTRK